MSIELVMLSNHLIFCFPLLLLPSNFPSIRVFSIELALCLRWPKYWSFSFSISPSSEYSGLISFGIEWLDLLAVHGTLKSLLQHHSSKASILQSSAFKEKREKGTFLHYWWESNLIQSLWRTVSRFFKKLGNKTTKWPSNPTTGHILWGNHNWKGTCIPICITAILKIVRHGSNIDEWIRKLRYMYTMKYYSTLKGTNLSQSYEVDEPRACLQSEASLKEKNKYHILLHIYGI